MLCFFISIPVIFFSCLTILARLSNTMLSKNNDSRHHCLLPDLKGKAFHFSSF